MRMEQHKCAFENLNNVITSDAVLKYYYANDKIQIIADACPKGVGAVLVQIGKSEPKIISYFRLTKAEQKYCLAFINR